MTKIITPLVALFIFQQQTFASALSNTHKNFIKKLGLVEGQYEVQAPEVNAADFCDSEVLSFETTEDGDKISLMIGSNLIFPAINKSSTIYESDINCKTTQTNLIENKNLTITQNESCKGKKNKSNSNSNSKVFKIKFSDELIMMSIKANKKTTTCNYKKLKTNQMEK